MKLRSPGEKKPDLCPCPRPLASSADEGREAACKWAAAYGVVNISRLEQMQDEVFNLLLERSQGSGIAPHDGHVDEGAAAQPDER